MHPFLGGFLTAILLLAGHQFVTTLGLAADDLCDQRADEYFLANCEIFCNDSSTCRWSILQSTGERVNYCQCEEFNAAPITPDVEYPCSAVPPPRTDVKLCDAVCAQTNSTLDGLPLSAYYCQDDEEEPFTCVCAHRMTSQGSDAPASATDDSDPIIMPRKKDKEGEGSGGEGCNVDDESIGEALKALFMALWRILKGLLLMIYGPISVLLQALQNLLTGAYSDKNKPDAAEETEIQSPAVTDYGTWGDMERCDPGSFVHGFRLKYQEDQGPDTDDNGLTGVAFICRKNIFLRDTQEITSSQYDAGEWGEEKFCPKGRKAVGFQLRSMPWEGTSADDMAAVDFRLLCNKNKEPIEVPEGNDNFGDWTEEQICPKGTYLCGIQTEIEDCGSDCDNTALNNVKALCCPKSKKMDKVDDD